MPEESKKGHDKKKNDPKEQRRPRQRHQAGEKQAEKKPSDAKTASKSSDIKTTPKVIEPQKPVHESPPPEFYQNLKRETDEILKITDEENNKYKKKEIQSNWTKYEMPIESYDEIDEQESMGADYEKLIQAPLSVGGHFQFKHEKSWDVNTGPSLYDKYFDINMEDLNLALCTIPFHERNSIEQSIFTETDILSMNNRTARFKQKYFNDKLYATAETEAQDKILRSLIDKDTNEKDAPTNDIEIIKQITDVTNEINPIKHYSKLKPIDDNIECNISSEFKTEPHKLETLDIVTKEILEVKATSTSHETGIAKDSKEKTELIKESKTKHDTLELKKTQKTNDKVIDDIEHDDIIFSNTTDHHDIKFMKPSETVAPTPKAGADPPKEADNPDIESPEDLEKWLDDFLDG